MTTPLNLKDRAKAFDTLRNNTYPVDPNFLWVCQDTERLHPTKMATPHLFNALKMIWNHNVPDQKYIIQPYTHYRGVRKFQPRYRRDSIRNLFNELMNRPDRTRGMEEALVRMAEILKETHGRCLDWETPKSAF